LKAALKFAIAITMLGAVAAHAADLAILRNGNSIRHERRQVVGPVTRLYLSDSGSGYIEIPTDQIERFERDTAPSPVPSVAIAKTDAKPAPRAATRAIPPAQAAAVTRAELNNMVTGAGERHQIDPDFINSVIRAESGFHSNAVSKKGAQGLMQLMPGTASQLGVENPFDPNSNVEGGTKYLRELLEKYNYDPVKALAAYNAGSKRVDKYHGVPPYYETQAYIARIIRDYNRQKIAENPALGRKAKVAPKRAAPSQNSPRKAAATQPAPRKTPAQPANTANPAPRASLQQQASR
jgi:soluble lytic murein transglycosylase-like protein